MNLRRDLKNSALWIIILTFLFILQGGKKSSSLDFIIALPFFVVLYFAVFTIGRETIIKYSQAWIRKKTFNAFLFPALMLLLYVIYLLINGQNPLVGNPLLCVYITFIPVLAFTLRRQTSGKIGWFDFTIFVIALLPSAFFEVNQSSEIPFSGGGFDSFFHVIIILSIFYSFAVIRGIKELGFFPEFKWKSFATAILVWLSFYALVLLIGIPVGFIRVVGYSEPFNILFKSILFTMIGTFLHTALFEELFFSGHSSKYVGS